MKRCCKKCGIEYEYELFANLILYCPNCDSYDHLECEYGYGPVVPCKIYHGGKEIAMITYDANGRNKYRVDSDKYNVHKVLEHTYLEALYEARDIITHLLNKKGEK